jgi:hypothetical protein
MVGRSNASTCIPPPARGNVTASVASAMPYTQNAALGWSPCRAPFVKKPANASTAIGSEPLNASRSEDRSSVSHDASTLAATA